MLKIWELKAKADQDKARGKTGKRVTGAQLRLQKDVSELNLPPNMSVEFPNPDDLMHFKLFLTPPEGIYRGGRVSFTFSVNSNYPIEPPKIKCDQKIYHPNIDPQGNVCLNILREDWKPVLSLTSVLLGIQFLFLEPNPGDPLNKTAAQELVQEPAIFERHVRLAMAGGVIYGERYDRIL